MAKTNEEEVKGTGIVLFGAAGLPADMAGELAGLSGLGYSEKQEDGLVPILSILQDNSGEVKKGHSRRIDGAEAGYLIIRATKTVIDPSKQVVAVQPCAFMHVWQAWKGEPGEGVPTGTFPFDDIPADAKLVDRSRDDGAIDKVWVMPDDSYLVDTRQHYGHILLDGVWRPIVIPMAGTNHKVSRGWTETMKAVRVPGSPQAIPAWFRGYQLDAKFNQRGQQSWYNYEFKDLGFIQDKAQRDKGREMFEALQAGTIQADVNSEAGVDGGSSSGDGSDDVPI